MRDEAARGLWGFVVLFLLLLWLEIFIRLFSHIGDFVFQERVCVLCQGRGRIEPVGVGMDWI